MIFLRILGPEGKPYVDLENEFTNAFRNEGACFSVPRLFSSPVETTVAITIGIGVITGVSTYLITSLIDKLFRIKGEKNQNNTNITFNIQVGDKFINLPVTQKELLDEIEKIKNKGV